MVEVSTPIATKNMEEKNPFAINIKVEERHLTATEMSVLQKKGDVDDVKFSAYVPVYVVWQGKQGQVAEWLAAAFVAHKIDVDDVFSEKLE